MLVVHWFKVFFRKQDKSFCKSKDTTEKQVKQQIHKTYSKTKSGQPFVAHGLIL